MNLAVFSTYVGVGSQPYIQRHVNELLRGRTVLIGGKDDGPNLGRWEVECPVLLLNRIKVSQMACAIAHKFNVDLIEDISKLYVKRFLKQHQVSVMMGEFLDRSLPMLSIAKDMGLRFFAHAHGFDVSVRLRDSNWQAEYLKYNQADGLITINQTSKSRLIALGINPDKIFVIPCGVHVPKESIERPLREDIRCLAVGRMVSKKAPILTLDAFRRAAEIFPNLRLDYVGEGPLFSAAEQFVLAFHLEQKVALHGELSNKAVWELMQQSDIFIQHSRTAPEDGDEEGLPVAILEAMANSLPVVSTWHAGIPEAVEDEVTGYLVNEGATVAMAQKIAYLAQSVEQRMKMGRLGWVRVTEHFSWEKEKGRLIEVLGF